MTLLFPIVNDRDGELDVGLILKREFDTNENDISVYQYILNMENYFLKCWSNNSKETRLKGIRKAANAGKFKGRKPLSYEDCPDFVSLYESYRHRGMTKGELADRLNVSSPTPDKLILQYKGEKDG